MSFVVRKLRLAEEDALEAAIWYEERQAGLGGEFLDEIDRTVRAPSESALHNRIRFADVRRAVVARFKFYGIYYTFARTRFGFLRSSMGVGIRGCCVNVRSEAADVQGSSVPQDAGTSTRAACAPQNVQHARRVAISFGRRSFEAGRGRSAGRVSPACYPPTFFRERLLGVALIKHTELAAGSKAPGKIRRVAYTF